MPVLDFKVGGQPVMTNQPSRVQKIPAQPAMTILSGGGAVSSERPDGVRVVVTWGTRAAKPGAHAEIQADIDAENGVATLTWTDPNSGGESVTCALENAPYVITPGIFAPFSVTFLEVPS